MIDPQPAPIAPHLWAAFLQGLPQLLVILWGYLRLRRAARTAAAASTLAAIHARDASATAEKGLAQLADQVAAVAETQFVLVQKVDALDKLPDAYRSAMLAQAREQVAAEDRAAGRDPGPPP